MRKPLFVIISAFCFTSTSLAQTAIPTHQIKTPEATGVNSLKSTVCTVQIDASGHRNAVLTESTGSKVLDEYIKQSVGAFLNNSRYPTISMSVPWKAVNVSTAHGKSEVTVAALRPPYPYQARARNEQGNGLVKASFDESGHCVSAEMAQSTGSKILDGNTVNYALARWRSSGSEKVTTTIPVIYRLQ